MEGAHLCLIPAGAEPTGHQTLAICLHQLHPGAWLRAPAWPSQGPSGHRRCPEDTGLQTPPPGPTAPCRAGGAEAACVMVRAVPTPERPGEACPEDPQSPGLGWARRGVLPTTGACSQPRQGRDLGGERTLPDGTGAVGGRASVSPSQHFGTQPFEVGPCWWPHAACPGPGPRAHGLAVAFS